jgi:DNA-binding NarL/FixJ family response regulator
LHTSGSIGEPGRTAGCGVSAIRVVVGEDSYLIREGIVRILDGIEGIEVAAACGDLDSLRAAVRQEQPDVVLTDIRMPPTGTDEGIRLAVELRESDPEIGVVVLSQHVDPRYALALFREGSDRRAYILKERIRERDEIARAIREVASGGSLVDTLVVEKLLEAQTQRPNSRLDSLTPREREILAIIAKGASNAAIADELVITKRAVERHINAIFTKLEMPESESEGVSRRVSAALIYLASNAD